MIGKTTSSGQGFYRYGDGTPGTEDGYGDCNVDDSTVCTVPGQAVGRALRSHRRRTSGSGHLWPVLSGERAEHEIATGNDARAVDSVGEHGAPPRPASG